MNCPTCNTKQVRFQGDVSWRIPWEPHTDNTGKLHKHDPNKHFVDYKCRNGHIFEQSYFSACDCGWQATNT